MARYIATADVTVDGILYPRGTRVHVPTSVLPLSSNPDLDVIPRVRPAGLEFYPDNYQAIASDLDKLGYQHADGAFPPDASGDSNVIPEPRLPAANTQYD